MDTYRFAYVHLACSGIKWKHRICLLITDSVFFCFLKRAPYVRRNSKTTQITVRVGDYSNSSSISSTNLPFTTFNTGIFKTDLIYS